MTLLLSSHDMDVIEAICDRVIIMNRGKIVANDTVENLLDGFQTKGYRITAQDVDKATIVDLRERFNVMNVERVDGQTQFEVTADSAAFYRLTDVMERHGLELVTVETVQPDLAEVFIEMTGKGESVVIPTANSRGDVPR